MHPGGIADKIGNRFEARWLIHQLLGLLDGKAISVVIEHVGERDEGFEFSVQRQASTEWHQCKRQTSSSSWTIRALDAEGVLANFAAKIAASPSARCVFVSTDAAKQLKLLTEKLPTARDVPSFERALSQEETRNGPRSRHGFGWMAITRSIGSGVASFVHFPKPISSRCCAPGSLIGSRVMQTLTLQSCVSWLKTTGTSIAICGMTIFSPV